MASYDGVHIGTYSVRGVKYLRLWWYAGNGSKRIAESLGAADKIPKTEWKALRLAREAKLAKPIITDGDAAPTLAAWWDEYVALRPKMATATDYKMKRTHTLMVEFFGADRRLDTLKKRDALEFRAWLGTRLHSHAKDPAKHKPPSPVTVANHIRIAHGLFGDEHGASKIYESVKNPFAGETLSAPSERKGHPDLSKAQLARLVAAGRHPSHRCLLALVAYAGLRLGEALRIQWSDIAWGKRQLTATATKNTGSKGKRRICMMEPELERVLKAAKAKDKDLASPCAGILHHPAYPILKAAQTSAGLAVWPDPFGALRRLRDSLWSLEYPGYVVAEWMGHSEVVSKRFYLDIPKAVYKHAAVLGDLTEAEMEKVVAFVEKLKKQRASSTSKNRRNIGATNQKKTKKTA